MPATPDNIEQALSAWLSSGPFADPDFLDYERKLARWDNWLARLTEDDIHLLVQETVHHIDRAGGFSLSDPWGLALTSCLIAAGRLGPETYLELAERYRHTQYRSLFLSTAGELFSDTAIEWLLDVAEHDPLNESELRLLTGSFYASGSPQGLADLDRLLASIPAEYVELRALIGDRRSSLADAIAQTR